MSATIKTSSTMINFVETNGGGGGAAVASTMGTSSGGVMAPPFNTAPKTHSRAGEKAGEVTRTEPRVHIGFWYAVFFATIAVVAAFVIIAYLYYTPTTGDGSSGKSDLKIVPAEYLNSIKLLEPGVASQDNVAFTKTVYEEELTIYPSDSIPEHIFVEVPHSFRDFYRG